MKMQLSVVSVFVVLLLLRPGAAKAEEVSLNRLYESLVDSLSQVGGKVGRMGKMRMKWKKKLKMRDEGMRG